MTGCPQVLAAYGFDGCGGFDDDDTGQVACLDTDDGATDTEGDGCAWYTTMGSDGGGHCELGNHDDFTSSEMCCVCGGGRNAGPDPTDNGSACKADTNKDGFVNVQDLMEVHSSPVA